MKNFKLINIWYFIQGYTHYYMYKWFSIKFMSDQRLSEKLNGAKECVENEYCVVCGCTTLPMLFSSKPCPKSEIKEKPCYVG